MPEQFDDKWGGVNHRGRAVFFMAFFMAAGFSAVLLGRALSGLENDLANGWRTTVTEPLNALVDDINNTGNLKEVTAIGLGLTAGLLAFWLALSPQYWQKKSK